MKKPTYVKKLCKYWYEGLSERNIVSVKIFEILLLLKYPEKWFDLRF